MKIGILETGKPPQALEPRFGDYAAMFRDLFGPEFDYAAYDVEHGELPADPSDCDAYVITGSPAGVYDDLPWLEPLKRFLVQARGQPLVGVCFGHQIMAEAFGGRVVKSEKGWGIGQHTYAMTAREPWMDEAATIAIPVSHQDQVVELPPGARVLGGSDFTPYGVLAYADRPAISFQCHPEFDPAYAEALLAIRRGVRLTEEEADAAIASLHAPNDDARVGGWIRRFLEESGA